LISARCFAAAIDSDGSFQIKILKRVKCLGLRSSRPPRSGIRLYLQIDQKRRLLLDLIEDKLGGRGFAAGGYRKSQDTYYYSSTSFGSRW